MPPLNEGNKEYDTMRLSRPLMQLALLGSVIFFTTPTFAQESKIETQAVRCLAM